MLEKIDTGERKLLVNCDQLGVMAAGPHKKTFKGPDATAAALAFAKANGFEDRAVIEKVMKMPEVPVIEGPSEPPQVTPVEVPIIATADRMIALADEFIELLANRKGSSTKAQRRKFTELGHILDDVKAAMQDAI
jgi:hypothetical protein